MFFPIGSQIILLLNLLHKPNKQIPYTSLSSYLFSRALYCMLFFFFLIFFFFFFFLFFFFFFIFFFFFFFFFFLSSITYPVSANKVIDALCFGSSANALSTPLMSCSSVLIL